MHYTRINNLKLWQFEKLADQLSIKHFVTDRHSLKHEQEFSLSLSSSPNREEILLNRKALADALDIDTTDLYFPSQVHETRIVLVNREVERDTLHACDALITNTTGICIAVMSADCVPILLFDKTHRAVGAIHSGWRGTVKKILEKTLHAMAKQFGTEGKDLIACIGPSVCQDAYEVGEEVIQAVDISFGATAFDLMKRQSDNKARLDLWQANKVQLLAFGVPEWNIEVSNLCTVKNNASFFSARKGDTGRFAAGIQLL